MYKLLLLGILLLLSNAAAAAQSAPAEVRYSVPDINARATLLITPQLPADVLHELDGKTMSVKVTVGKDGVPLEAKCSLECPKTASDAIEQAARESRFGPLIIRGQAEEYTGILLYSFVAERVDWYKFGTGLRSTLIFDNISLGPVAAQLPSKYTDERTRLLALDKPNVELETRWKTIRQVAASLDSALGRRDKWLFKAGMSLRGITAPLNAMEPTDRSELQLEFEKLADLARDAPDGIEPEFLQKLSELSRVRIDPEVSEKDLRKQLRDLTFRMPRPTQ